MAEAKLVEIDLPDLEEPLDWPELDSAIFAARLERFRDRLADSGFDGAAIYADREHAANLSWLTGFDPRFEEALMILTGRGDPMLITGPENQGPAADAAIDLDVRLYPPMGLLGQDRSRTPSLEDLIREAGLTSGVRVGVVGWKSFLQEEAAKPDSMFEIPAYIVSAIADLVGPSGRVCNAAGLLMDPDQGLRAVNELDQLARFECAACHTSSAIHRVVTGVHTGMRELEAARLLQPFGLPLSCHTMMTSGARAWRGLLSPGSRIMERGDPVTAAYGVTGALNCRAGWLARGADDLPEGARDYVERLVAPYFETVAAWLEMAEIGLPGGNLDALVRDRLGDPFFGIALNPGHLIGLEEWMHSPVAPGSEIPLASGMALQVDIIPATGGPYFTTNIEDGIILLDARGRAEFKERYPEAWTRIEVRRDFLRGDLGISIKDEVLPVSNIAGWLPPFWLYHGRAMAMR